ncbi:SMI1/KNR4 family protein [Spirobacillus cienkowskii]|uniref:SMI1/KNR4 family protein n=1 Tax=Spirobacillus cienkowskii TaxID=495820 RepID=UPI0030CDBE01
MKKEIIFESKYGKGNIYLIQQQEEKIGFKFPQSYINLILEYNGCKIKNNFDSFDFNSNSIGRIDSYYLEHFFSFNKNADSWLRFDWHWENTLEFDEDEPFPKNIVPFASDPGREKICFDYRHDPKTDNPKIVVWHAEEERGSRSELSFVATRFDEFLDMLYDDRTEKEKIQYQENSWKNRENRRKEALENQ